MRPDSVPDKETFFLYMRSLQLDYLQDWESRGKELGDQGVYSEIVDALDLDDHTSWIDFCCGTGRLMEEAYHSACPTSIGFDYSIPNLARLHSRLYPDKLGGFTTAHKTVISGPPYSYTDVPLYDQGFHVQQHAMNYLHEDIRTLQVLPRYLDQPADRISLTFPGIPLSGTAEGGHPFDTPITEYGRVTQAHHERRMEWMHLIRPCAEEQASTLQQPGGLFVYATRIGKPRGESPMSDLTRICDPATPHYRFQDYCILAIDHSQKKGLRELSMDGRWADDLYLAIARFKRV